MTRPLNIAHRGGAGLWPENTLFAVVSAAEAGFDGAEFDIQLTADGKLVLFHDFRLQPELCRDREGHWLKRGAARSLPLIRDLTYAELRNYDVGRPKPGTLYARDHSAVAPRDGEHIPLLSDVIVKTRSINPGFRLFVEIKTSVGDPSLSAPPATIAEAIVTELRASNESSNIVLVSFDRRALAYAKMLAPDIRCWLTTAPRSRGRAQAIKDAGFDGWFCSLNRANAAAVNEARALDLSFGVWTVNQPRDMEKLIACGVYAICTDRPDLLRDLLTYSPSNSAVDR